MDPKHIEHELKNYKLREGVLEKRSKFLKEWRDRWVVITQNYLFTFKSSTELNEPTDILDLRQIKSIKSYVKKYEDRELSTFKLSSEDASVYLRCRTVPQKWSWIVFFERLLEHKNNGSTNYNDYDAIRRVGFCSVEDFENKKTDSPKRAQQKGTAGFDLGKILQAHTPEITQVSEPQRLERQLMASEKQIQRMQVEAARVAAEQYAKKVTEEAEQAARKNQQEAVRASEQEAQRTQKLEQQKQRQYLLKKQQQQRLQAIKNNPNYDPLIDSNARKVSQLKNLFEKKIEESTAGKFLLSHTPLTAVQANQQKKVRNSYEDNNNRRSVIVAQMFNEFNAKNSDSFKYVIEFLVEVASNDKTGFTPHVIYQSKFHTSKKTFADIFIEHYTESPTEEQVKTMLGFLYVVYYQCPSLFNEQQAKQVKKCLVKFLSAYKNEEVLAVTLKTIIMINHTLKFDPEDIRKNALTIKQLEGSKSSEVVEVAKKAKDVFGIAY